MAVFSKLIDREHRGASICMLLAFVAYSILYPVNMLLLERPGWIWDYPARNLAMEHMLVVNYVVLGAFFLYGARAPLRYVPLIDFTIVFNIVHGTMMLIDALAYPGHERHLRLGGDVPATYLIPLILILSHPKRFYLRLSPIRSGNAKELEE
jgi:hypothetical protein